MTADPLDHLGRSLIADEYRGDYAAALRAAEEESADVGADRRARSRALLSRALVEVLAGNPGAALQTLESLLPLIPREDRLLGASLAMLAQAQHNQSGIDGSLRTFASAELTLLHTSPSMVRLEQNWLRASSVTPLSTWEDVKGTLLDDSVLHLLSALQMRAVRSVLLVPGSPEYRKTLQEQPAYVGRLAFLADRERESLARWARLSGGHAARAFAERAKAELAHASGDTPTARHLLAAAQAYYFAIRDDTGAGACAMQEGDWLAAPGSSPLLLGMLTAYAPENLEESATARRAEPSPENLAEALHSYRDAEDKFAASPRGRAALLLRYGYLAYLRDDFSEAARLCWQAMCAFEDHGDERGRRLSWFHSVLYRIAGGTAMELEPVVTAFTEWAAGPGSPALAFYLADLANAWGTYLRGERGDVHGALRCHELAALLYRGLGAVVSEAESRWFMRLACGNVGDERRVSFATEQMLAAVEPALSPSHPLLIVAMNRLPTLVSASLLDSFILSADAEGLLALVDRLRPLLDRLSALTDGVPAQDSRAMTAEFFAVTADGQTDLSSLADLASQGALRTAKALVPLLAYAVSKAKLHAEWIETIQLSRNGHWSEAQRLCEALLSRLRGQSALEARELEPYVLLTLARYDEAAAAFDRVIEQTGFPPHEQERRWIAEAAGRQGSAEEMRYVIAHSRLTFFVATGHYAAALAAVRELERLRGTQWWRPLDQPWAELSWAARAADETGRPADAERLYQHAIEAVESHRPIRRDSWQSGFHGSFHAADVYTSASRWALRRSDILRPQDPAAAQRYAEESFRLSERGRARGLSDLLMTGAPQGTSRPLFARWRAADARATVRLDQLHRLRSRSGTEPARRVRLEREVADAEQELADVEQRLARENPRLLLPAVIRDNPQLIEQIAAALPQDGALLAFRSHGNTLMTWVISSAGLIAAERREVHQRRLGERIRLFVAACRNLRNDWGELGEELSRELLVPVAPVLTDYRSLVVVPSGDLHRLPVHALPLHGEPLLAAHEISYLPAASLITRPSAPRPGGGIAVFGNPAAMREPDGTPAPPLAGAEKEAMRVAAIAGTTARTGEAVTRAAVLDALRTSDIVHVATHAYVDQGAPLNSGVLLADGDILTAADLVGATIGASLVMLTGCSTAEGLATLGDDVMGLPRALLIGGANAVAVAQWDIYDGPTAELVGELHHRLRDSEPVTRALRHAQNEMRLGRFGPTAQHPGCWAPLIVIGDPRP